jgi:hypothetical protein
VFEIESYVLGAKSERSGSVRKVYDKRSGKFDEINVKDDDKWPVIKSEVVRN